MIAYFAKHTGRLGYFGRLRAGRSIGSTEQKKRAREHIVAKLAGALRPAW